MLVLDPFTRLHFPTPAERTTDLTVPLTKPRLPGLFDAASTGGIFDGDPPRARPAARVLKDPTRA